VVDMFEIEGERLRETRREKKELNNTAEDVERRFDSE